jgi:hypothetical protein
MHAELREIESQGGAGNIEHLFGLTEIFDEFFCHADVLRTLTGENIGYFHLCSPY